VRISGLPMVCAAFFLISSMAFAAQSMTDAQALRQKTRDAVLLYTNFDFAKADQARVALTTAGEDTPYPYFLEAYKLFWRFYLSGDDEKRTAEFQTAIQRLCAACSTRTTCDEQDRLLFLACSHFFTAAIDKERGHTSMALIEVNAMRTSAKELLRLYPGLADARFIDGAIAASSRIGTKWITDLKQAAESGYYFAPIARFVLAETLGEDMKDWNAAQVPYQLLTAEYPGNALFSFYLAQSYQHAGRLKEGLDTYRQVISSLHVQPPATYLLCRSYFYAGQILENQARYDDAISEYENALQRADLQDKITAWFVPWSHLQIGRCLERAGRYQLALSHLTSLTKSQDKDAYRHAQLLAADIRKRVGATGP